ncbi:hypothetical protein RMSM_04046 [Rhodopirellula maiorica SM1]|uniref:Uncharacterized protein n=1 Tax=Rhodopirellula maiorica SM1 TaxID=1265738 RepID=M5RI85_9BACT|nr:hypothetical protein RMSM_04046 [Rhodopirellula maiorica SM1]
MVPRQPRRQDESVIYHIISRSDGRCQLFDDSPQFERFTDRMLDLLDRH